VALFSGCAQYNAQGSYLALLLLNSAAGTASSSAASQTRIFLTQATHNGNFVNIAGADAFCNADANRPSTTSTYKALLADAASRVSCTTSYCSGGIAENVDWVLRANTTYFRADGTTAIFTTGAAGVPVFNLTNSFTGAADEYWTGLRGAGAEWISSTMRRCSFWADGTAGSTGANGIGNAVDGASIRNTTPTCDNLRKLLCVEQ